MELGLVTHFWHCKTFSEKKISLVAHRRGDKSCGADLYQRMRLTITPAGSVMSHCYVKSCY